MGQNGKLFLPLAVFHISQVGKHIHTVKIQFFRKVEHILQRIKYAFPIGHVYLRLILDALDFHQTAECLQYLLPVYCHRKIPHTYNHQT